MATITNWNEVADPMGSPPQGIRHVVKAHWQPFPGHPTHHEVRIEVFAVRVGRKNVRVVPVDLNMRRRLVDEEGVRSGSRKVPREHVAFLTEPVEPGYVLTPQDLGL